MTDRPETGINGGLPTLHTLAELALLVASTPNVHIRYSRGFAHDAESGSIDTESGLELPGLSVNPLTPEAWWSRPRIDWLARQLCQYKHLQDRNPDRHAWVLRGRTIARGPDCEPLLVDVEPLARLDTTVLKEAELLYEERFSARSGPED
jgi:hypothetical protein